MNLSFDLYKVFYYVCKYMSITDAARHLYVSQPAITKQIKNLEIGLSKNLFIRSKKGLELTKDGEKLLEKIKDPVERMISIEDNQEEDEECVIKIIAGYCTIKSFLIKNISKFNEKHPNVRFEISTYNYNEAVDRLRKGLADLVFLNMKDGEDDSLGDIKIKDFCEVQDILVANKDYDNIPNRLNILDLNNYPIICKSGKSTTRKNIEEYFKKNNLQFKPKYELSNSWLIEEYVNLNLGIGVVTKEFTQEELKTGRFIEIETDKELPHREIGYAVRNNSLYNNLVDELINNLRINI